MPVQYEWYMARFSRCGIFGKKGVSRVPPYSENLDNEALMVFFAGGERSGLGPEFAYYQRLPLAGVRDCEAV
jgi:hypothetical protein